MAGLTVVVPGIIHQRLPSHVTELLVLVLLYSNLVCTLRMVKRQDKMVTLLRMQNGTPCIMLRCDT